MPKSRRSDWITEIRFTVRARQTLGGVLRRQDIERLAEHLATLLGGVHHVSLMDMDVEVTETTVVRP